MPLFIGDQGTGKGIILGALLVKIFDKLAIHCTNFGSVTTKFNSDLEYKSYVFVDGKNLSYILAHKRLNTKRHVWLMTWRSAAR